MKDWARDLAEHRSKGSRAKRPGSLAGLAAARREHEGQFFTPDWLARSLWRVVEHVRSSVRGQRPVAVFDGSIGSGRLVQFARKHEHVVFGCDVDEPLVERLAVAAEAGGVLGRIAAMGMEEARPRNMDVALINPPFSVHLESPAMAEYPCTHFGRFGPHTSALSHEYALHQALDAAPVVAAILPATYAAEVERDASLAPRLRALVDVPGNAFAEEGAQVRVSVAVFGAERGKNEHVRRMPLADFDSDSLDWLAFEPAWGTAALGSVYHDPGEPVVTRPVTGDRRVRIVLAGRRVRLMFACGYAEARVLNAIYRARIDRRRGPDAVRLPSGVRYEGEGLLDVEAWLATGNPAACLERLEREIRGVGFDPVVDEAVANRLRKLERRTRIERAPFGRWIFRPDGEGDGRFEAVARRTWLCEPTNLAAPAVMRGERIEVERRGGRFWIEDGGRKWEIPAHEFYEFFEADTGTGQGGAGQWVEIVEPLPRRFPAQAAAVRARALRAGVDGMLTWSDYQFADLVEVLMKRAAIVSWDTGLGKARLAVALVLASECRRGLIVVEAGLIDEMKAELAGLPIPASEWQVIETPGQARDLRRVNVISYTRLRMQVERGSRRNYAKLMRRRFGIVVADEADILCNPNSQQSRAVAQLAPKRRYALSATPARNYPRDLHPLSVWTAGDGTAAQPYGWRRAYMTPELARSMAESRRGIDRFRDDFIVTEWVTNEFAEENREGAKREVPKIADVVRYREWLAPLVKRRVVGEPDVARYVSIPEGETEVREVEWDMEHLAFYLRVADDFAEYWRRVKDGRESNNLARILARINAVCVAASCPQMAPLGLRWSGGLTSKQRRVVDDLAELAGQGRKVVFYARNVMTLELVGEGLRQRGIEGVLYHGGMPREKRTVELNRRFRYGDAPVLLASLGITQKGLNLWQADTTYFFDRSWEARTEYQARNRIERPQQTRKPRHLFLHLPGSIDEYERQMVEMKADAIQAGLDWGDPRLADQEFVHLDTILGRFVEDLAKLHGYASGHDFRDAVKVAA